MELGSQRSIRQPFRQDPACAARQQWHGQILDGRPHPVQRQCQAPKRSERDLRRQGHSQFRETPVRLEPEQRYKLQGFRFRGQQQFPLEIEFERRSRFGSEQRWKS